MFESHEGGPSPKLASEKKAIWIDDTWTHSIAPSLLCKKFFVIHFVLWPRIGGPNLFPLLFTYRVILRKTFTSTPLDLWLQILDGLYPMHSLALILFYCYFLISFTMAPNDRTGAGARPMARIPYPIPFTVL